MTQWLKLDSRRYPGGPAPDALRPPPRGSFLGRAGRSRITVKEVRGELEFRSERKIPARLRELIEHAKPDAIRALCRRPGSYTFSDIGRLLG
jgi:hypothetical protein